MSPLCPKAADRLLACSIPAGYWGEEVKGKLEGKAKGRKGNGEKGKKGKGREEEWKGKEEFCAVSTAHGSFKRIRQVAPMYTPRGPLSV